MACFFFFFQPTNSQTFAPQFAHCSSPPAIIYSIKLFHIKRFVQFSELNTTFCLPVAMTPTDNPLSKNLGSAPGVTFRYRFLESKFENFYIRVRRSPLLCVLCGRIRFNDISGFFFVSCCQCFRFLYDDLWRQSTDKTTCMN